AGVAALVAVPGSAVEAEGLRVGHAAADPRGHARQLAVDVALPRPGAGADHRVLHVDRVRIGTYGEGAADLNSVGPVPHERNRDLLAIAGHPVLALAAFGDEARLVRGCGVGLAHPAALGGVPARRIGLEQLDRRAVLIARLRVLQQRRVDDVAAL